MHTITDILYDEKNKELTAVIRRDGRPKAVIDILGDSLDTEKERRQAIIDEASRMGYEGATIDTSNGASPASIMAKKQWSTVSPEDRSKEMSRRRKKGIKKHSR